MFWLKIPTNLKCEAANSLTKVNGEPTVHHRLGGPLVWRPNKDRWIGQTRRAAPNKGGPLCKALYQNINPNINHFDLFGPNEWFCPNKNHFHQSFNEGRDKEICCGIREAFLGYKIGRAASWRAFAWKSPQSDSARKKSPSLTFNGRQASIGKSWRRVAEEKTKVSKSR